MKVGNRFACDACGKIESSKLKVFPDPSNSSKHICENCKQTLYYQNIEAVSQKHDSTRNL